MHVLRKRTLTHLVGTSSEKVRRFRLGCLFRYLTLTNYLTGLSEANWLPCLVQ